MDTVFKFKQFEVDQSGCAMKINTDGVLIGALTEGSDRLNTLDIGTGTGVVALMLAQRFSKAVIDAVELDEAAAHTARRNFLNSPFSERLSLHDGEFEAYFKLHPTKKYDLIVSNPPFYINSLGAPGEKKNMAKHADGQFFETLVACVSRHLSATGSCWLILPLQTAELVKRLASQNELHLQKTIIIRSYPDSDPHREIIVLNSSGIKEADEAFIIYAGQKIYSQEYQRVLEPFFTIF